MSGQLGEALGLFLLGGGAVSRDPYASDVITFTDDASVAVDTQVAVDIITFTDTATRSVTYYRSATDNITLTDRGFGLGLSKVDDTLTYTDSASVVLVKRATDTLTLTDTPYIQLDLKRTVSDVVETFDAATRTGTYNRLAVDTLTLTDVAVGKASKDVHDTLTFIESTTSIVSKGARDTLTYTDVALTNKTITRPASDTITFIELANARLTLNRTASDDLTLTDGASGGKIWTASATDNIAFTERVFRQQFTVVRDETLVYTDSATKRVIRNRVASDNLTLVDSTQLSKTLNVSASDTLVFKERAFPYKDGSGVLLNGQGSLVVLPSPEFNDYQSHQGKMIVKRSMAGRHRTLTKTTTRDKLNWRFVISGGKKIELEKFIEREVNNNLVVTDWEGRQWSFRLSLDTYDYTETARWKPGGNRFEVTLEFEGTRYYG